MSGGFEPGTSRFQIQHPKPLDHAASLRLLDSLHYIRLALHQLLDSVHTELLFHLKYSVVSM